MDNRPSYMWCRYIEKGFGLSDDLMETDECSALIYAGAFAMYCAIEDGVYVPPVDTYDDGLKYSSGTANC